MPIMEAPPLITTRLPEKSVPSTTSAAAVEQPKGATTVLMGHSPHSPEHVGVDRAIGTDDPSATDRPPPRDDPSRTAWS
jgi:hypothetical protein